MVRLQPPQTSARRPPRLMRTARAWVTFGPAVGHSMAHPGWGSRRFFGNRRAGSAGPGEAL